MTSAVADLAHRDAIIAGYEALRRRVLARASGVPTELGWALLVRRGLVEWVAAWRPVTNSATPQTVPACESRISSAASLQVDVVQLLAGMALAVCRRGVRA